MGTQAPKFAKKEILESAVLASNHFERYVQQTVSISGVFNQIFNQ